MKKLLFVMMAALALSGCSAAKPQSSASDIQLGSSTNATSTSAAADTQNKQTGGEAPKQQAVTEPKEAADPSQVQIDYAFTRDNQHPEKVLINVINAAKSNLDVAIYSLTFKNIANAIVQAKKRGVAVRIITDTQEAKNAAQAAELKTLKASGIPIKENKHKGLMHLKVTIADKSVLTTGSFNYSDAAAKTNDEVLVSIHDPKMAAEWDTEFDKMWADTKNFQDYK